MLFCKNFLEPSDFKIYFDVKTAYGLSVSTILTVIVIWYPTSPVPLVFFIFCRSTLCAKLLPVTLNPISFKSLTNLE